MSDAAPVLIDEHVVVRATRPALWAALTSARQVGAWWCELDGDLRPVAAQRVVRTGSYSFYRLWVERRDEPGLLELTSAYLGVGPVSRVRFELRPVEPGGEVELRLREWRPDDGPAATSLVVELWRHRLSRLKHSVEGTEDSEPDEIVCRQELSGTSWRPLHRANLLSWLPVSGPEVPPRWFYVIDSLGARPFPVTDWHRHYDERLQVSIAVGHPDARTRAEVAVVPGPGAVGLWLRATHRGWSDLPLDAEVRQALRSRFRATWGEALAQAAERSSR